jgi:uncharacterized damage-inducible protein DinB
VQEAIKDLIISQYEHVREWVILSCRGVTAEQSVSIPAGANNHILWELGHIVNSEDYLIVWGCAGLERLTKDWDQKFGYQSKALPDAAEYPSIREIQDALEMGSEKTQNYLSDVKAGELASPPKNFPASGSQTVLSVFAHFLLHEAYHVGKISLLRKMLGLPSVAELLIEKQSQPGGDA